MKAKYYFIACVANLFILTGCENTSFPVNRQKGTSSSNFSETPSLKITRQNTKDGVTFLAVYEGPEFTYSKGYYHDDAHKTSTHLTHAISKFLKSNYTKGKYYAVNLKGIRVSIEGDVSHQAHSPNLCRYSLTIPLLKSNKHHAATSIEHRGTWIRDYVKVNEREAYLWKKRIENQEAVGKASMRLVETEEGFKEYWIQFKSRKFAS